MLHGHPCHSQSHVLLLVSPDYLIPMRIQLQEPFVFVLVHKNHQEAASRHPQMTSDEQELLMKLELKKQLLNHQKIDELD